MHATTATRLLLLLLLPAAIDACTGGGKGKGKGEQGKGTAKGGPDTDNTEGKGDVISKPFNPLEAIGLTPDDTQAYDPVSEWRGESGHMQAMQSTTRRTDRPDRQTISHATSQARAAGRTTM